MAIHIKLSVLQLKCLQNELSLLQQSLDHAMTTDDGIENIKTIYHQVKALEKVINDIFNRV